LSDRLDRPHDTSRDYRDRLVTLGRRVRVEQPDGVLEGDAVDLDDEGALIVRDDDGRTHSVLAADVVHVRG
jgi:BirA family biotin operon repressor/biotin-[acetyl-CoA-carboxylase] ligase